MSNREKAAEVIADALRPALPIADGIGYDLARALSDEGVLAPDPIPLNEDDRNFVIDTLKEAVQQADYYGLQPTREAWEVAVNAFVAHTTAAHTQKEETNE